MAQTVLNFRAEPELVDVVKSIADDNNVDTSEACRMLIREGLRSVTVQVQQNQLHAPDPRYTKRHHPMPLDDAVLAVKAALNGDRDLVERILVTGRSVASGVVLAYLGAGLLVRADDIDPEDFLDQWSEQFRSQHERKQIVRRARAVARGRG